MSNPFFVTQRAYAQFCLVGLILAAEYLIPMHVVVRFELDLAFATTFASLLDDLVVATLAPPSVVAD